MVVFLTIRVWKEGMQWIGCNEKCDKVSRNGRRSNSWRQYSCLTTERRNMSDCCRLFMVDVDVSDMCIREMAVVFKSLGVAPTKSKVAEIFCRDSFGGTVVDMDFERSFKVAYVRVWDMVDKEQMGEEKPVSLIGSPVCDTLCDLSMVMRDANGVSEVKNENLVEGHVKHFEQKGMYEI